MTGSYGSTGLLGLRGLSGLPAYSWLMRAMTTSEAALALGLSPDKLRRWVREGRFFDVAGVEWDKSAGFKRQRLYTKQWVLMVAKQLGITAEFSQIPGLE